MAYKRAVDNNHRNRIIREYYEKVKPDMDYKEFEQICKTPFMHLRHTIADDTLFDVRLMYFGKFTVKSGIVVWMLEKVQEKFDKGDLTSEEYHKQLLKLTRHVSNNPDKFTKYRKRIKRWIYLS